VDVELRYDPETGRLDMGVFAPSEMMSVEDAESMVKRFVQVLT
jgi:ferricrocin synthase